MLASQSSGPMYRKLGDVSRTTGMNSGRSGIRVMSPSTASHIDRSGRRPYFRRTSLYPMRAVLHAGAASIIGKAAFASHLPRNFEVMCPSGTSICCANRSVQQALAMAT